MEPRGPSAEDEFGRVRHPLVPMGLWVRNSSRHWGTNKPPQPGGTDEGRGRRFHFPKQPYATRASLDDVQCIAVGSNNWMCQKKKVSAPSVAAGRLAVSTLSPCLLEHHRHSLAIDPCFLLTARTDCFQPVSHPAAAARAGACPVDWRRCLPPI